MQDLIATVIRPELRKVLQRLHYRIMSPAPNSSARIRYCDPIQNGCIAVGLAFAMLSVAMLVHGAVPIH